MLSDCVLLTCEQQPLPGAAPFAEKYTVGLHRGCCLLFLPSVKNTFGSNTALDPYSLPPSELNLLTGRHISQVNADMLAAVRMMSKAMLCPLHI